MILSDLTLDNQSLKANLDLKWIDKLLRSFGTYSIEQEPRHSNEERSEASFIPYSLAPVAGSRMSSAHRVLGPSYSYARALSLSAMNRGA